jgi:hypothetical protein
MTAPIPMLTCRHFYDTAVEEAVNLQIKNELSASYIYLAMVSSPFLLIWASLLTFNNSSG